MNSTKSSPIENEERLCELLHRLVWARVANLQSFCTFDDLTQRERKKILECLFSCLHDTTAFSSLFISRMLEINTSCNATLPDVYFYYMVKLSSGVSIPYKAAKIWLKLLCLTCTLSSYTCASMTGSLRVRCVLILFHHLRINGNGHINDVSLAGGSGGKKKSDQPWKVREMKRKAAQPFSHLFIEQVVNSPASGSR